MTASPHIIQQLMPNLRIIFFVALLTILATLQAATATAESTWLYAAPATLENHYDQARIELKGHDSIFVDAGIYYSEFNDNATSLRTQPSITYKNASQWETGRTLSIAYSTKTGAVLLDPATGQFIEIISGLQKHPLDIIQEQGPGCTAGTVDTIADVANLWQAEIQRIYARLRREFPQNSAAFDHAEAQWHKHCQADHAARHITFNKQGSIHSISSAYSYIELYRNHALRLAQWGRN